MRLNLSTDYALRILIYLATEETRLSGVAEVSAAYGIPRSTVMKLVSDLVRLGWIQSARGRAGGIRLARPPTEINLGAVIRATEETLVLADCGSCAIAAKCGLKGIFREAVAAFVAVLDRYSLADLMENRDDLRALFQARPPAEPGCDFHVA